jgi:soluble lytic murein transglycosylase
MVSWKVLGIADPDASPARHRLEQNLSTNRTARAFLNLAPVPAAAWPLWQKSQEDPEEKLLALGLWGEADPVVLKHFPLSDLSLAYTAGINLAATGRTNRSLYIAEILSQGLPDEFPAWMLPHDYRRLLYPIAFEEDIRAASRRFEVDPNLMLSIFRQESRFDPTATSPASARGLAQFVYPTAAEIGKKIGHWPLKPEDLEDPAIAIVLSAAYLSELGKRFHGVPLRVAAAYNAGPRQASLWDTYCYSRESDEFYTKVSFGETRGYIDNVLRNRAHYREIYGDRWGGSAP